MGQSAARLYSVGFDEFYTDFNRRICECEILQLMKRYNIFHKSILSIGPGTAHEEFWFVEKGENQLTLFDIDESGSIEPQLQKASQSSQEDSKRVVKYYIGDFTKFNQEFPKQFDVLYLSSFTPDELRRAYYGARPFLDKWINRILKFIVPSKKIDMHWSFWRRPFHESVYNSLSFLKKDGLLVIQSYCGGIDLTCNPNYVQQIKSSLAHHGVQLIDIYFLKESPAVTLLVGFAGTLEEAVKYYHNIKAPLKKFHGRTELNNIAKHFYSITGES